MSWTDHVLPHGPLQEVVPGFWQVQGTLPRGPLPRTMAIARQADGRLWLHSVIALDEPTLEQLLALGDIGTIVVPSGMHRLDAAVFAERFPDAVVVCPEGARAAVAEQVRVQATCEEHLPSVGIQVLSPPGLKPDELVYEVPVDGGVALVFCDALFNLEHQPGLGGLLLRLMGSSGFFGTTRLGRFFMGDAAAWKQWLQTTAPRTDLQVLSVAHGEAVTADCAGQLRAAADRL